MLKGHCVLIALLCLVVFQTVSCERLSQLNVSGLWKGTFESTDKRGHKWQGPVELTLNQKGDAITGTFVFTPPQAERIQVPISSGVVSKDSMTFSGQKNSIELTFHGKVSGPSLNGTASITSRSRVLGPPTLTVSLNLTKQ